MSAFHQALPDASPGIDMEVLSRINSFFLQDAALSGDDAHTSTSTTHDTGRDSLDEVVTCPGGFPESEPIPEDGCKEGTSKGKTPSTPLTPKIIARYTYPSEHRAAAPARQLPHHSPTSQPSLLGRIASFVGSFFDNSPAIIEYTDKQIKQRSRVRIVEAQHVKYPTSAEDGTVVRVVALVNNGVDEDGEMKATPVEIRAMHRRVRELLKDEVGRGYVAEEVYAKEIRGAFRKLKRAGGEC